MHRAMLDGRDILSGMLTQKEMARRGGKAKAAKMTARQLKAHARKMNKARWAKRKAKGAEG